MNVAPKKEPRLWQRDSLVDGRVRVYRGAVDFLLADELSADLLRTVLNAYEHKLVECENRYADLVHRT